jgi:hypothetical protein
MPPTTRILLLGGHGKVSLFMTPKLVSRSWHVTSVIRNADQTKAILEAGRNGPGKIDVLVESLDDVKSDADAQRILDKVKPDWVVWSAGTSAHRFNSILVFHNYTHASGFCPLVEADIP